MVLPRWPADRARWRVGACGLRFPRPASRIPLRKFLEAIGQEAAGGVKLNAFMLRETFGFENILAQDVGILARLPSPARGMNVGYFPVRVVLGEDVGIIANATPSMNPLHIFTAAGSVTTITPGTAGAGATSREAFIRLMNGLLP
jgi:hypothetical protein